MKTKLLPLLAALLFSACSRQSDQASAAAATPASAAAAAAGKSYPLRGIVTDVVTARSALMVKHEDIPGFMPAMTMLLKVDADTLKSAVKDQTITATIYQQGGDFWLRDVKPAAARK